MRLNFPARRVKNKYRRRKQKPSRRLQVRRGLMLLCLAVFLYSGVRLILWAVDSRDTAQTNAELQALHEAAAQTTAAPVETAAPKPAVTAMPTDAPIEAAAAEYQYIAPDTLDGLSDLLSRNADMIGWLKIDDVVNLPVLYRDNEYYLTHDFYGREKSCGALFLDENHPFTARTQHLVIHGHNMHDGSMFGKLSQYEKQSFGLSHGIIHFTTLYRGETYLLLAACTVSTDPADESYIAYCGTPVFSNPEAFDTFIGQIETHALYRTPIDVQYSDALLTLSTCLDDDRLIIICRRVREDETQESVRAMLQ